MVKACARKENLFEFILSNIDDAVILTGMDGAFRYVCPNVHKIFGHAGDEIERIGNIAKLIGKDAFSMDELRRKGELLNVEWRVSDKDSKVHVVLMNIRTVRYEAEEMILYVVRDITHRHNLEKDLRAYQRIVSATDDFISLVDENYVYRIVNGTYLRLNQTTADQLLGRSVADNLGEDVFREMIKDKLDRSLNGETVRYQSWFVYPQAGPRFMDITYSPYVENGRICGVVVNGHDITELKRAEDDSKSRARRLEERNIALKVVLDNREEEKQALSQTILNNFERRVFPFYERLSRSHTKEDIQVLLEIVASNMRECLAPLSRAVPNVYRLLTPMEIQVADLIKSGKTSKEISTILNISTRSVFSHRNNIRRKFQLINSKTSLRRFLEALS